MVRAAAAAATGGDLVMLKNGLLSFTCLYACVPSSSTRAMWVQLVVAAGLRIAVEG